jgi:hypothetical protein
MISETFCLSNGLLQLLRGQHEKETALSVEIEAESQCTPKRRVIPFKRYLIKRHLISRPYGQASHNPGTSWAGISWYSPIDQARYAGTLGSSEPSTKFLKKVVAREM